MDEANFKGTDWRSICSEELNYTYLKPSLSFDELPIAVSELLNLAVHRPLKVPEGGGGGYCHIWALWVCAAEKGMVFKQFALG